MKDNENKNPRNPYITPEGYFDSLQQELLQISEEKIIKSEVTIRQRIQPYIYIAAGYIMILFLGKGVFSLMNNGTPPQKEQNFVKDGGSELNDIYLAMDEYDIIAMYLEDESVKL